MSASPTPDLPVVKKPPSMPKDAAGLLMKATEWRGECEAVNQRAEEAAEQFRRAQEILKVATKAKSNHDKMGLVLDKALQRVLHPIAASHAGKAGLSKVEKQRISVIKKQALAQKREAKYMELAQSTALKLLAAKSLREACDHDAQVLCAEEAAKKGAASCDEENDE